MQIPLQISMHGIERSNALYDAVRENAEKLERYYDRITSCRVVLERDGRHKRQDRQFTVRIDLEVPGGEIAVTREHAADVQVALGDAFDAARRKLESYAHGQHGDARRQPPEDTGRIQRIDAVQGCGFIMTDDGREYRFSRDSVTTPPFEELAVGTAVRFVGEATAEGFRAKRVSAHGKGTA